MYKVITIAGSDSCCGAGVQADLKVIDALGAYGTCAVTAVTAQNTLGVSSVFTIPPEFVRRQIDAVISDMGTDALKTGMLVNEEIVETVCDAVKRHNLGKVVVDPVIKSHKGERLLTPEGMQKLRSGMLPLSLLVTPNIPEAEILTNRKITSLSDIKDAAQALCELGVANVLIKGGHAPDYDAGNNYPSGEEVVDVFYDGSAFQYFREVRFKTEKVHGTGCMFSAAIATELAKGSDMICAITTAKAFITKTIKESLALGHGYRLARFRPQISEENC